MGSCRWEYWAGKAFTLSIIIAALFVGRLLGLIISFLQLQKFGRLPIIGGRDCDGVTKTPAHKETFKIGDRVLVTALHTPCHTQDSICYYMEDGNQRSVFTGDTLFIGGKKEEQSIESVDLSDHQFFVCFCSPFLGCGRFFEGNATEMNRALNQVLAALPDDTRVFVSLFFIYLQVECSQLTSASSPDMNTPKATSSSALQYPRPSPLRDSRRLRQQTGKRRASLPLGTRR